MTNQPLNVGKDGRVDGVEVVISLAAAQLSGRVAREASQRPGAPAPRVVLFPEDSHVWQSSPQSIKAAQVNGAGQFTIRGIAPGAYRIAAVRNLAEGGERDPTFLAAIQRRAGQVVVAGGKVNGGILQAIDAPR